MKHVAYFCSQFNERGTSVALYDYAHYNETILGNQSYVFYFTERASLLNGIKPMWESFDKFKQRFGFKMIALNDFNEILNYCILLNISVFHCLHYGLKQDGFLNLGNKQFWKDIKTIKHVVFNPRHPQGDVYCVISDFLNKKFKTTFPVLPHIIHLPTSNGSLHEELGIPKDAVVFGRYGGFNEFDIEYVKPIIHSFAQRHPKVIFLFMNTRPFSNLPNIIHVPCNVDILFKCKFLNTIQYFLHARVDGETFGLSIGEASFYKKTILSSQHNGIEGRPYDMAHFDILKDKVIIYNETNLYQILEVLAEKRIQINMEENGYLQYTPEKVMKIYGSLI